MKAKRICGRLCLSGKVIRNSFPDPVARNSFPDPVALDPVAPSSPETLPAPPTVLTEIQPPGEALQDITALTAQRRDQLPPVVDKDIVAHEMLDEIDPVIEARADAPTEIVVIHLLPETREDGPDRLEPGACLDFNEPVLTRHAGRRMARPSGSGFASVQEASDLVASFSVPGVFPGPVKGDVAVGSAGVEGNFVCETSVPWRGGGGGGRVDKTARTCSQ